MFSRATDQNCFITFQKFLEIKLAFFMNMLSFELYFELYFEFYLNKAFLSLKTIYFISYLAYFVVKINIFFISNTTDQKLF